MYYVAICTYTQPYLKNIRFNIIEQVAEGIGGLSIYRYSLSVVDGRRKFQLALHISIRLSSGGREDRYQSKGESV